MRLASFGPTPSARLTIALSCAMIACDSSSALSVERIESATLAPTPCTVVSSRNQSRSLPALKPYRSIASSRTSVSTARLTGPPLFGRAPSVRAEQRTR